ncbi:MULTISPECIES: universal stress protein [unclassified Streptomyces]|uniref:universal stress protein n=1 Tax=unclassified Streptomyces TaxID=2593676 RepID=UPI0038043F32
MDAEPDQDLGSTWWEPPPNPELFGHVVVGVDGSPASGRALDAAVAEADRRDVRLEILHGQPWGGHRKAARQGIRPYHVAQALLASAAARAAELRPGLRVSTSLVDRHAGGVLVRRTRDAGLAVVGTRGHGAVTGALLGSVSLHVAGRSACPLLVVRGESPARPTGHGHVVLGLESDADTEATAFALAEADRRHVPLTVLHTWTSQPTAARRQRAGEYSAGFTERSEVIRTVARLGKAHPEVATDIETVHGTAPHVLLEATRTADVVVVAAHRRAGGPGPRLGPVTRALLHGAYCPVAVVPVPATGQP